MKTYEVTIKATIYKTIMVEARDEDEASENAHDFFSVLPQTGIYERYLEETVELKETEAA